MPLLFLVLGCGNQSYLANIPDVRFDLPLPTPRAPCICKPQQYKRLPLYSRRYVNRPCVRAGMGTQRLQQRQPSIGRTCAAHHHHSMPYSSAIRSASALQAAKGSVSYRVHQSDMCFYNDGRHPDFLVLMQGTYNADATRNLNIPDFHTSSLTPPLQNPTYTKGVQEVTFIWSAPNVNLPSSLRGKPPGSFITCRADLSVCRKLVDAQPSSSRAAGDRKQTADLTAAQVFHNQELVDKLRGKLVGCCNTLS